MQTPSEQKKKTPNNPIKDITSPGTQPPQQKSHIREKKKTLNQKMEREREKERGIAVKAVRVEGRRRNEVGGAVGGWWWG